MRILVSACLLGEKCRYNGSDAFCKEAAALSERYELVPVCPEALGGLKTPRKPSEIRNGRVFTPDNEDVTEAFVRGAQEAVRIALLNGCKKALLKSKSPSCGSKAVYDGSFSSQLTHGMGLTADALKKAGLELFEENEIFKL